MEVNTLNYTEIFIFICYEGSVMQREHLWLATSYEFEISLLVKTILFISGKQDKQSFIKFDPATPWLF